MGAGLAACVVWERDEPVGCRNNEESPPVSFGSSLEITLSIASETQSLHQDEGGSVLLALLAIRAVFIITVSELALVCRTLQMPPPAASSTVLTSAKSVQKQKLDAQELLRRHQLHDGLYARVAKKLRFDASYVSRVARGKRKSLGILRAIVEELRRIENL